MSRRILLPHHDVHARVLEYDVEGGEWSARRRSEVDAPHRGFYVELPPGVAGLYASPSGPVFFLDGRRVPLTEDVLIRLERGRRRNTFALERDGRRLLELSYAPPDDIGVGDFSSETERDFFAWVAETFPDPQATAWYTCDWPEDD